MEAHAKFMSVFTNETPVYTCAAGRFPHKPVALSCRVLRGAGLITAATVNCSVADMAGCATLTTGATDYARR
jgi:hypothetical protein